MRVLITGVTGQDGFYLSELLHSKGYEVFGLVRRRSQPQELPPDVIPLDGDVCDASSLQTAFNNAMPDEVYHLAALSHVFASFKAPHSTFDINLRGTLNVITLAQRHEAKFYQASTSELFGDSPPPQNEQTPMRPRSPYAISKLSAYWLTKMYRERGMYAVNGILFNHESPRRGADFVTQKVVRAAVAISRGKQNALKLGNFDARRDWGHAMDYCEGMWLMMQQPKPDDYVMATGESHSVRELCELAFSLVGLDYARYVESSDSLRRPLEVENLCGDAGKIKALGWTPRHKFSDIIKEMISAASI